MGIPDTVNHFAGQLPIAAEVILMVAGLRKHLAGYRPIIAFQNLNCVPEFPLVIIMTNTTNSRKLCGQVVGIVLLRKWDLELIDPQSLLPTLWYAVATPILLHRDIWLAG